MNDATLYQYCIKLVVFRNSDSEVLVARRVEEADYNQTYAFIGGKLETSDMGIVEGIRREKNEEIGRNVKLRLFPRVSFNVYFIKQNGQHMIVPHVYAEYLEGDVTLSDEYDDYKWIPVDNLKEFEPKIANLPEMAEWAKRLRSLAEASDFVKV